MTGSVRTRGRRLAAHGARVAAPLAWRIADTPVAAGKVERVCQQSGGLSVGPCANAFGRIADTAVLDEVVPTQVRKDYAPPIVLILRAADLDLGGTPHGAVEFDRITRCEELQWTG